MSFSFFLLADKITETLLYRRSRSRLTGKYEEKKKRKAKLATKLHSLLSSKLPKPKIMAIFFLFLSPSALVCVCVCLFECVHHLDPKQRRQLNNFLLFRINHSEFSKSHSKRTQFMSICSSDWTELFSHFIGQRCHTFRSCYLPALGGYSSPWAMAISGHIDGGKSSNERTHANDNMKQNDLMMHMTFLHSLNGLPACQPWVCKEKNK